MTYRTQHQEFPGVPGIGLRKADQGAYCIHRSFDRLYTDWSTLLKLSAPAIRLMASSSIACGKRETKSLNLPANISIDDPRVQFELTRYLDNWFRSSKRCGRPQRPAVADRQRVPNLGKYAACRGWPAPSIRDRRSRNGQPWPGRSCIKLGCVMPGESPILRDALRRLSTAATYLYQDGVRFAFDTTHGDQISRGSGRAETGIRMPWRRTRKTASRRPTKKAISAESTRCLNRARMCRMILTRGWSLN